MFPVLFSVGKISVSSYGLFLAAGFLFGVFLVWRLARAWDLNEEKTLDLSLLAMIGGLIGARLFFVLGHLSYFLPAPFDAILVYKMPGFSFLGAILGGLIALWYFIRRFKMDFWQIVDIAFVGVLGGLILADLGCFFGGCDIGIVSKSFYAVSVVGVVGTRWPVQILESLLFSFVLFKVWSKATHFHQRGKIAALSLIYIGIIKILLDFLKDYPQRIVWLGFIISGFIIYYRVTKQNPIHQLKAFRKSFTLHNLIKTCYNQKTSIVWKFRNFKKVLKKHNVKFTRKNT